MKPFHMDSRVIPSNFTFAYIQNRIINLNWFIEIKPLTLNNKYILLIETAMHTSEIPFDSKERRDQVFKWLTKLSNAGMLHD